MRAENTLLETEQKTGIIRRFLEMQSEIEKALELTARLQITAPNRDIQALTSQLSDILNGLKG
jgi:hypothetical protein